MPNKCIASSSMLNLADALEYSSLALLVLSP
jgi:hypothetical protein